VLEDSNNTISKEEYTALVNGKEHQGKSDEEKKDASDGKKSQKTGEEVAVPEDAATNHHVGISRVPKKRKVGKVVGAEDEQNEQDEQDKHPKDGSKKKAKKKAKAIKMQYDDEVD
jgi:hypothetical protein